MGILRVYLALCVIADHAGHVFPWRMHEGRQAVQIFYVISGFYMAMILSSRYGKPRDFYISRFLRIFPPYWIVLVGTVVASAAAGLLFNRWLLLRTYVNHPFVHNGPAGIFLSAFTNLTIIGQDWIMFLQQDAGQRLHFTADFWNNRSPLWRYLLVPQSWSIGLELTFYAFAPYLNRLRSRWLAYIAIGALGARLLAYRYLDLAHDPWDYRFFPFEISLFLFGMLGYRLYARTTPRHPSQRWRCASGISYLFGAALLLLLLYVHLLVIQRLGGIIGPEFAVLVTYPFLIAVIPVLFFIFGNHKFDRLIGELSYPIYLLHYFVLVAVANVLACFGTDKGLGMIGAAVSVVLAAVFYRLFIARLDKKRHFLTIKNPGLRAEANKPADQAGAGSPFK
ncbi:MAG TPA: acyltransferase [Verrucomicrobiae bacterium]|jgi:peptidoglycan/LPS O-acetylase OafA/YrhL|nr:acyltransferase [Verrucomicrobiae bacterium]